MTKTRSQPPRIVARRRRPRLEALESRIAPAVFLVLNTSDSGAGSLRQALLNANVTTGGNTIAFDIQGVGVHTIAPASPLPTITESLTIDGTTQPGYGGTPLIVLNGSAATNSNGSSVIGLHVTAGNSTIEGLDVNGFSAQGIYLEIGNTDTVRACYIGVDPSGELAVPNGNEGIYIQNSVNDRIGGPNTTDGNLISGNKGHGINIASGSCSTTLIENNTIGTDVTGTEPLGNNGNGININANSPNDQFLNNLISGNSGSGIGFFTSTSTNPLIQGNLIGTDRSGIAPIANSGKGVDDGGAPGMRVLNNVISGNDQVGVNIGFNTAINCVVQGNDIGVAKDGVHALGNLNEGVSLNFDASNDLIGGTLTGQGNVIAYNGRVFTGAGVTIDTGSVGVTVEGNAIYSNYGLGIDLNGDGVTLNPPGGPHTGANDLQNYPVLTSALLSGGNTVVAGSLNSTPSTTFRLEFFASPGADPSGHGQGRIYLGASNVTTDGSGNATINATLSKSVPAGDWVSATATAANGDTSEFSAVVRIPLPTTGSGSTGGAFVVTNTADSGAGSLRQAITSADEAGGGRITFQIPGLSVQTITPTTALPPITAPITIDGTSQPGYSGTPLIVLNGSAAGTSPGVIGLHVTASNSTIEGLDINGFSAQGIYLEIGSNDTVRACYIGVDPTGAFAAPNANEGIYIQNSVSDTIGGPNTSDGNLISGNKSAGINIASGTCTGILIENNTIGTDVSGTEPLGNGGNGVNTNGDASNAQFLNNLISGNSGSGLGFFSSSSNMLIQGNLLGTDRAGVAPIPNSGRGIDLGGPSNTRILDNLISGNDSAGINTGFSSATGNVIQGNLIGVAKDGVHALGNGNEGFTVNFNGADDLIGGTAAGQGNVIAYNGLNSNGAGVEVDSGSVGITVEGNSIYSNGRLGIDLGNDGVTLNTPGGPHTGPNNLQNFPVLTSALATASGATVTGTLNSAPNTMFRVEFFANPGVDPTGYGQARLYLGFLNVTTDGTGNVSFTAPLTTPVTPGWYVSSAATDPGGDTSELSADIPIQYAPVDLSVGLTAAPTPLTVGNTLTYTITVTNNSDLTASDVYLSDLLPSTITLGTITVSQGTFTSLNGIVNAELGSIAGGGTATMTINVTPNDTTTLVDSVSVGSIATDPSPGNNTASLVTPVQALAAEFTIIPSLTVLTYGQTLSFQTLAAASLPGQPTPTGQVTFTIDGQDFGGSTPLVNGAATSLTTHTLAAGTHSIGLVYSGDGVYQGGTFGTVTVSVGKANLTVMAQPSQATITYGAALPTYTVTYSGFLPGDTATVVSGAPAFMTTATATSGVGTYPVSVGIGTLTATNYNFTNFVGATLNIVKAHLTVTANSATKVYGAAVPPLTYSITGFVNGDTPSVVTGAPSLTASVTAASPVGSYQIGIGFGTLATTNYTFNSFVNGSIAVTKAHLTVTADSKSRGVGGIEPAFTYSITGFVNSDTLAMAVTGRPTLTSTDTLASPPGTYSIIVGLGSLSATNYDFTNTVNGVLTVRAETPLDFDASGHAEMAVFRPTTSAWYAAGAGGTLLLPTFGAKGLTDIPVSGDFDGTGRAEQAIYRPATGQWYALGPSGGHLLGTFGGPNDIPVPGNYDGTGRAELAVFRPSTSQWFVLGPTGGRLLATFGAPNLADIPVSGDFDGVGHAEPAVFRVATAEWFVLGPNGSHSLGKFGGTNLLSIPVPGDYDGIGKAEPAVFMQATSQWFALGPNGGHLVGIFGAPNLTDVPLEGAGATLRLVGKAGVIQSKSVPSGPSSGTGMHAAALTPTAAENAPTPVVLTPMEPADLSPVPGKARSSRRAFEIVDAWLADLEGRLNAS